MSYAKESTLQRIFALRHGPKSTQGWSPRMRARFGYFSPDIYYEAVVAELVNPKCTWVDLGCGGDVFPSNPPLADELSATAGTLVGVDPSPNVHRNRWVHEKHQGFLSGLASGRSFDLITLRMVAEHVDNPEELLRDIQRVTTTGSRVVIYTVNYWSPVTLLSAATPFWLHQPIKWLFWRTKEEDTFPTVYKMNTRKALSTLFQQHSFEEEFFAYLDDCRTLGRWRWTHFLELVAWRVLSSMKLVYPENCILGVYRRA